MSPAGMASSSLATLRCPGADLDRDAQGVVQAVGVVRNQRFGERLRLGAHREPTHVPDASPAF
jgi:hypothetical protein